ncbi:hypothetical protein GO988_22875 [Hymenobacter sp. HMF4947]|uniref:Glycosyltransferase subfamily 4-like N-terminal domain-containing protein n=1 Tax=Hymenobacter ginkgonis TaxID=2682976 RepID=A0A7K1TLA9_9BACT|nr:hypothetical protein [Hymenobacter ginkgonis]MVN79185.1 hypothetical protein [Hymenobacter ginkgonis]
MSLPATSVAILVLAWDETTPAVRALVDATAAPAPVVDSVVVVVPSGGAGNTEPSQEEFLPLAAAPEWLAPTPLSAPEAPVLVEAAPTPTAASATAAPTTEPLAAVATADELLAPVPAAAPAAVATAAPIPLVAAQPPAGRPIDAAAASPSTLPPPVWTAVRVLRLSNFSLPALAAQAGLALPPTIWTGLAAAPAAPYIGSEAIATESLTPESQLLHTPDVAAIQTLAFVEETALGSGSVAPLSATVSAMPSGQPVPAAALPPTYLVSDLAEESGGLEADDLPLALATALPPEPTNSLPEAEPGEPVAPDFAPEQAGWPEALAALQQPVAEGTAAPNAEEPAATHTAPPVSAPEYPALRTGANVFEAPNLNFQVIQYARFAVPLALADTEFATIYAPAWPTWLAAQELRQRTGRPLVLHVSTLAAAADDSVETATGWQAELQRQALHRADLILTETPALALRLRHDLSLPAATVRTVPAADIEAIAQAVATALVRSTTNQG